MGEVVGRSVPRLNHPALQVHRRVLGEARLANYCTFQSSLLPAQVDWWCTSYLVMIGRHCGGVTGYVIIGRTRTKISLDIVAYPDYVMGSCWLWTCAMIRGFFLEAVEHLTVHKHNRVLPRTLSLILIDHLHLSDRLAQFTRLYLVTTCIVSCKHYASRSALQP